MPNVSRLKRQIEAHVGSLIEHSEDLPAVILSQVNKNTKYNLVDLTDGERAIISHWFDAYRQHSQAEHESYDLARKLGLFP